MTTAEAELFDGSEFKVDFPEVDGHEVTELVLRIGGTIKLNRNDPEHAEFVKSLELGRFPTAEVSMSVDSKHDVYRPGEDGDTVTHVVGLKIHSVTPA